MELARGATVKDACRKVAITEHTYYRWRREYGGLKLNQARKLKQLEKDNSRLEAGGGQGTRPGQVTGAQIRFGRRVCRALRSEPACACHAPQAACEFKRGSRFGFASILAPPASSAPRLGASVAETGRPSHRRRRAVPKQVIIGAHVGPVAPAALRTGRTTRGRARRR